MKEPEKIFDPHYKLISFVCKLLMNSTITVPTKMKKSFSKFFVIV